MLSTWPWNILFSTLQFLERFNCFLIAELVYLIDCFFGNLSLPCRVHPDAKDTYCSFWLVFCESLRYPYSRTRRALQLPFCLWRLCCPSGSLVFRLMSSRVLPCFKFSGSGFKFGRYGVPTRSRWYCSFLCQFLQSFGLILILFLIEHISFMVPITLIPLTKSPVHPGVFSCPGC